MTWHRRLPRALFATAAAFSGGACGSADPSDSSAHASAACDGQGQESEPAAPDEERQLSVDAPVASSCDALTAAPQLQPIVDRLAREIPRVSPGTLADIGVEWFPTTTRFVGGNGGHDRPHVSASSAKFVWAAAALRRHAPHEVEPDADPTFRQSDNYAAGRLIDLAGGADAVNAFTRDAVHVPTSALSLCQWDFGATREARSCSRRMSGDNFFTPSGVLGFLQSVYKGEALQGDKRAALLAWSQRSPRSGYGGWLGTQLPKNARAAMHHKAGWLPPGCCGVGGDYNWLNEIGIVPTSKGAYGVALLLAHGRSWERQTAALEWASCVVYHAAARDARDPFAPCHEP